MHVTHDLLLAVLDGRIPRGVLTEIVKEHLMALCSTCRREIETFDWRQVRPEPGHPSVYTAHIERLRRQIPSTRIEVDRARREGARWLEELRRLPATERRGKVERARTRFRGDLFADLLVDEATRHLPEDPWEAHSWADSAFAVCYHTPGVDTRAQVLVRAVAHRGNAFRAMGLLQEADGDLRFARRLAETEDVTDLSVLAELSSLEASLRKDQRLLDEAERLLKRAILLYRLLGQRELRARSEIKLGLVHYDQEDSERAIQATERGLRDLVFEENPHLYLSARFNLARALEDLGRPDQALALMEEDRALHRRHFDRSCMLRVVWLEGKIALALDRKDEAEARLAAARQGFVEAGVGYDAAMVSLELALLLLERGAIHQVQEIAREAFQIFGSQNVHPEAFASLKVFRDAAIAERLTEQILREVHRHFRHAGLMPPEDAPAS